MVLLCSGQVAVKMLKNESMDTGALRSFINGELLLLHSSQVHQLPEGSCLQRSTFCTMRATRMWCVLPFG